MTNGHHLNQAFEGQDLPSSDSHLALEKLIELADAIQERNLDTVSFEAAMEALEVRMKSLG